MRNLTMRLVLALIILYPFQRGFAQLQPNDFRAKPDKHFQNTGIALRSTQCSTDTVRYAIAKASSLRGLNINTITSADKVGQWFDAPQQMMLHGFSFYAWQNAGSATPVTLTCRAVLAGSDSMPTGPVIATVTLQVDSTFANGSLNILRKQAVFANPVLVDYPFVLLVETSSPLNVAIASSDWDSTDGGGEWLAVANIPGSGWLHGYEINVGGLPFDADFLFEPHVTYSIDAQFTASPVCFSGATPVTFSNTTMNPILQSRFYNQYIFNSTPQLIYTWDYDDGSPLDLVFDTTHLFPAGNDYDVRLNVNMVGWTRPCIVSHEMKINPSTTAGFTFQRNALAVQFTNNSMNADSCFWSFGDGQTSVQTNPAHTYQSEGNYNVTLVCYGQCEGDTLKTSISLCNNLSSGFSYDVSGLSASFNVAAITGSVSFLWTFGDGGTASGISVSHNYASAGIYNACLIATNLCTSDTTCLDVEIISTSAQVPLAPSFTIFPNPAGGILQIQSGFESEEQIDVMDAQGKIHMRILIPQEERNVQADISNLPAGIYFLKSMNKKNRGVIKMVKY